MRSNPAFPNIDFAPEKEALNCVRVLTRILPFIYEADNLESWEQKFFWGVRRKRVKEGQAAGEVLFDEANPEGGEKEALEQEQGEATFEDAKPLAEELLDTLVDLLFFSGFTIPISERTKSKVNYTIWTSGVGCNTTVPTNSRLESNRTEVLRLLLTITSKSMYMPASKCYTTMQEALLTASDVLPIQGVKAITHLVTCPEKQVVLSLLCSLLNTVRLPHHLMPYENIINRTLDHEIQPGKLENSLRPCRRG